MVQVIEYEEHFACSLIISSYIPHSLICLCTWLHHRLWQKGLCPDSCGCCCAPSCVPSYFWEQADRAHRWSEGEVSDRSGGWKGNQRGAGGRWQQKQHRAKQPALAKCFLMWFYYITELAHGCSTTHCTQENKIHRQTSERHLNLKQI